MAAYETADSIFNSVLQHREKYQGVSTMHGAYEFNQNFSRPVEMEEIVPPRVVVDVIDAVQRKERDWAGVAQPHIEYVIKMSIDGQDSKIKIVGKRYSDLNDLHRLLHERKLVDPKSAP